MVLGHRSGRSFYGAVAALWNVLQERGEVEEKSESIPKSNPGPRCYRVNRPFAKCLMFATREEAEVWASKVFGGFYDGSEIVEHEDYPDTILAWEEDGVTYGSGKGLLPPEGVRFRSELYPNDDIQVFTKEPPKVRSYTLASPSWSNLTTALGEVTFCTRKEAEVWLKVTWGAHGGPEVVGSDKEPNSCLHWKKDGIEWVSGFGALPPNDVEVRRVSIPPMLRTKSYGSDCEDCPRFHTRKESEVFQQISYLDPPLTIPSYEEPTSYLKGYDSTGKLVLDSRVDSIPDDHSDLTFDLCDFSPPAEELASPDEGTTAVPFTELKKLVTKIEEAETMHPVDLKPLKVGEVVGFEPLTGKVESTVGNPVVSYRYGKADLRFRTREEAEWYATAFCLESGLGLDLKSKVEECSGREANAAITWKDPNKDWVYVSGDGFLPENGKYTITVCYLYEIDAYHKGMRILRSSRDIEVSSGEEVKPTLSFVGKGGARFRTKEEAELWGGEKVEGSQEGLNSILVWEEDGVTYGSGKGLLPKGLHYSCVAVASEPDYDNLSYMEDRRHIFFEPPKSWGKEGFPYRFATREEAALASPEGKFQPFEFEPNRVLVWEGDYRWKLQPSIQEVQLGRGNLIYLSGSGFLPKEGYSMVAYRDLHRFVRDLADMRPRSTFDLGVNTGYFKGNVDLLKIRSYSPARGAKSFRFGTREEAEFWVAQKNPEDRRIFTSPLEVNVYFKWGDGAEQNSKGWHDLPPKGMPWSLARIPGSDLVYPEPDEVLSKGTPMEVAYRVFKPSVGTSLCTFRTQEEAEFYSKWWGGGYSVEPTSDKVDAVMAWPLDGITLSETEYGGPICVSGYGLLPPNSWSWLPCSFFEQGGAYYGRVILCTEDDIARAKEKEATPPEPSEEAVCTDVAAKVDSAETSNPPADDTSVIAGESEIRSYVLTTHDPSVRQFNENKGALPVTFRLQTKELAELWQTGSASSWSIEPSSLEPNSVLLWRTKGDVGYRASNDPIGRDSETLYPDQGAHSYALVRKSYIRLESDSKSWYYRDLPVVYMPPVPPVEKESSLPFLGFLGALGLMHGVLKGASPSVKRVSVPKVPKAESEVVVESEVYESVAKGLRS